MRVKLAGLGYAVRKELRTIQMPNGVQAKGEDGKPLPSYFAHDRNISERLVTGAIEARYGQDGAKDKSIRKMNGRIRKAVDLAVINEKDSIDLDRSQVEHLLSCFDAWEKCPTDYYSYSTDFVEHLEAVVKGDEAKDEEPEAKANGTAGKKEKVRS